MHRISIKVLILFYILRHWAADLKKKASILLVQVVKKVVTLFKKRGKSRAEPFKFTVNISKLKL